MKGSFINYFQNAWLMNAENFFKKYQRTHPAKHYFKIFSVRSLDFLLNLNLDRLLSHKLVLSVWCVLVKEAVVKLSLL